MLVIARTVAHLLRQLRDQGRDLGELELVRRAYDFGTPLHSARFEVDGTPFHVHGIGVDPQTRRVFVNDRGNKRIQVFDENGKFLDQWTTGGATSDIHLIYVGSDRNVWGADRGTSKIIKWDLNGNLLYSWGSFGDAPGQMFGVHGMSTDQEGNFYVAEVGGGRAQKFRPRPSADPALMVGKPFYSAWR